MVKEENFMNEAIRLAELAQKRNEVPVGAILVDQDKKIIARGYNLVEKNNNPTCHAEKIVIEKALRYTKKRYLENCDIWVTLEPCAMCSGLIKLTRIRRLYYGAEDKKGGAIENGARVFTNSNSKNNIEIYSGISSKKCEDLIRNFFKKIRQN